MSRWKQLLGLDQATAHGTLQVRVRYLDGSGADGEAAGSGFLSGSPRGLVWKIGGYQPGNRDWPDVTGWTLTDRADDRSELQIGFEGMLRVRQEVTDLQMTVRIVAGPRELRRLTRQAARYVEAERIIVVAATAAGPDRSG